MPIPAIPLLQAIANTAAFHFPTIAGWQQPLSVAGAKGQQRGSAAYPDEYWPDRDHALPTQWMWRVMRLLTAVDPVTGVTVTFPDFEVENELF